MIHTAHTVRTLQAVAMTVGLSILLWSTGLPTIFRTAEAASITNASDTLSTSAPGNPANHTIEFTTPNGMAVGETITVTFPTGANEFVMGSVGEDDVDILVNGSSSSTAAAAGAGVWGVTVAGGTITFETPTDAGVASATPIEILIGTNAVTSGAGANQITNPSATTSYEIAIGGTMQDSGHVRIAIVDQVTVSASVDTSLTFTVSGVVADQSVNGSPTTTATDTTATTLPFGTLDPYGTTEVLAHDLSVSTNAANGYTVTVEQSGDLQSSTGATIDGFIDGNDTTTPSPWQAPAQIISNPDTWGHWGITSSDGSTTRTAEFGSDEWVSGSTTPVVI
ncbi:MAG TPA: hypothetical protein VFS75_03895, partial [Candidatus Paceibacterota bacterium]|nr:hypothetical protein [Candidatus Paceibacterota bacterium]